MSLMGCQEKIFPEKSLPWRVRGRVRVRLGIWLGLESVGLFSGGYFFLEPSYGRNFVLMCFFNVISFKFGICLLVRCLSIFTIVWRLLGEASVLSKFSFKLPGKSPWLNSVSLKSEPCRPQYFQKNYPMLDFWVYPEQLHFHKMFEWSHW